ncbi:MAG: preprotein translocase subunit SecG [bacterium]|nr:preprotein translocase subunit SecG [bacterium]
MIFTIISVILAIFLTGLILMQARGAGLGAGFGGDGNVFTTKRGIEKRLHQTTIVVAILFFASLLANILLS